MKSELEAKKEELNKVESALKTIEIELETQLTSVSQLSENNQILQNVQQKHDTLESELQVKLEELKSYSCQLEEANRANQDCQNQLKSTCDQLEAFKQEISEKNNNVIQLESALQMAEQKSESHANQLEQVMSQLAQGDENHNSSLAAFKKKSTDLEKEILELKNREASLKSNEQQMIAYQKELQDQIGAFEETESHFQRQLEQAKQRLTDKEDEIKQLATDLELKSRYEQEKEVSNKELQMQSIEYQKKLQDQLEQAKTENDSLLRESDSLAKQLNDKVQEALKETETLRSQLNATKVRIKKVNDSGVF